MNNPPSLRSRRDFQRVLRSGRKVRTPAGVVLSTSGLGDRAARLGLAVPSSVGGAVARNRIKRRLRAAFVAAAPPEGQDVVIRAGADAGTIPFQELEIMLAEAVAG